MPTYPLHHSAADSLLVAMLIPEISEYGSHCDSRVPTVCDNTRITCTSRINQDQKEVLDIWAQDAADKPIRFIGEVCFDDIRLPSENGFANQQIANVIREIQRFQVRQDKGPMTAGELIRQLCLHPGRMMAA